MANKTVMMRIPLETHRQMEKIKEKTERSFTWIIKRAVRNYFKVTLRNQIKE